jgi:hypothetical protein
MRFNGKLHCDGCGKRVVDEKDLSSVRMSIDFRGEADWGRSEIEKKALRVSDFYAPEFLTQTDLHYCRGCEKQVLAFSENWRAQRSLVLLEAHARGERVNDQKGKVTNVYLMRWEGSSVTHWFQYLQADNLSYAYRHTATLRLEPWWMICPKEPSHILFEVSETGAEPRVLQAVWCGLVHKPGIMAWARGDEVTAPCNAMRKPWYQVQSLALVAQLAEQAHSKCAGSGFDSQRERQDDFEDLP